ncbi:hypothetical protein PF003_g7005 [Phytophthora fragariae]|nr:hypothetical protein PF003_g7005 [Phytophthora fragariae]
MAGGIDQDAAAGCRPAAWNTTLAGPYTSSLASGLQTLDQSAPLRKSPPTSMLQVSQLRAQRRSTPSRLQPTLARVFASEGKGEVAVCKDEMLRALDKF